LEDGGTLHVLEIFSSEGEKDLSTLFRALEKGEIR
jgi:hypothetical protein